MFYRKRQGVPSWPSARCRRAAAVGLLAAASSGCARGEANESASSLQTANVTRETIVSSVEATGTIEPIRIIEVKSQAGGEILRLPVELGDRVTRGTMLVEIDPRDVRNAHDQAVADLEVAQAQFDVAERQLQRIRSLHDSAIVTDEELESAILAHATSKASLVRAQTNLELAADRLGDVLLRAPITGTIVERTIEVGQVITGTRDLTGGTVLMRMADLNEVQVRTLVDETDIGRLDAGLPAEIRVEAFPNRTFRGTVLKIEPQAVVEQNVTMFAVLTRISNEDDLLRPGMNSDVRIVVGREEDVLSLPNSAIKTQQEAQQIANALGLDVDVAAMARQVQQSTPTERGAADGDPAPAENEEVINGVPLSRVGTMSQDERRRWFGGLSPADRSRVFQLFQRQRESQAANAGQHGAPRPAFVFFYDARGTLDLKPIMIGLSNFDNTQVLVGLEEGEQVVSVPFSLVQQQDFLNRIRSRSGVPGVSRR